MVTAQGTPTSTAGAGNVTAVLHTSSLDFELTREQLSYLNTRPSLVRDVCVCVCVCVCVRMRALVCAIER